ncbi:MAG TPA: winged helix-turn-helix domain-containing protein, partial [Gemmataceae bacterium]|nr:winged helix-turn-helix domain-containing protein [Gemmataceae bacterium]
MWTFAGCEFDERRRELRVGGRAVDLEVKPFGVLHQLLIHAGEVVTKDELLEAVWPGVMVVDGSLATAISKLRKALGSDDRIVVTVPRVGYRLGVPAQSNQVAPQPQPWPELHFESGQAVPERPQWRLVRRLDLSPSSEVWLAHHPKTQEARVFKFAPDAEHLKGLKREVTLARLLRQSLGERPDFVRILEWNFDRPPYFIESEYCGPNLAEWTDTHGGISAIPLAVRLTLLVGVVRAVAEAHGLDVLHKDLKPGNILVSQEPAGRPQIKVADFGSASLLALARLGALGITNLGFTQSGDGGMLTGTMMYLAPEVLAGKSPSPASDVYSLGVLLYQLVIGDFRKPLAPGWESDVADPLLREDIAGAACGDPARRIRSASELAERLTNLDGRRRDAETLAAARTRADVAERKRVAASARLPWMALAGVAVLAALALTLSVYWRSSASTPP